ncbi:hypothetical protein LINPERHAP1_LOCUS30281, partial [Linum perenne]
ELVHNLIFFSYPIREKSKKRGTTFLEDPSPTLQRSVSHFRSSTMVSVTEHGLVEIKSYSDVYNLVEDVLKEKSCQIVSP